MPPLPRLFLLATLMGCSSPADRTDGVPGFRTTPEPDGHALWFGEARVLRHLARFDPERHDDTSKPYYLLYAPGLAAPVTKGLGGRYPHHRGLFLGWNRTEVGGERFDFWHMRDGAFQRDRGDSAWHSADGPAPACWRNHTDWVAPGGRVVVEDTRELTVGQPDATRQQIDLVLTLRATSTPVRLRSDPHHSGVHVRLAQEVETTLATWLRAGSTRDAGDDVWQGGDAVAARFTCQGRPCLVAMLADPALPRTRRWSTRPYGRLGVSWDVTLEQGASATMRCRVLVLQGPVAASLDEQWLEREFRAWATPVRATVEPVPADVPRSR